MKIKQVLKKTPIYVLLKNTLMYRKYKEYKDKNSIIAYIQSNAVNLHGKDTDDVYNDIVRVREKYGFNMSEYFQYHCFGKTDEYLSEFIGDDERVKYTRQLNRNPQLFNDKWMTYQKYRKYYKRDMAVLSNYDDCCTFLKKHNRFISKPIGSNRGNGVQIMSNNDPYAMIEQLTKLYPGGGAILEELISQGAEILKFHPQSVNTVRVCTMRFKDECRVLFPTFRIGRGESIVDNAGAGGIFGAINIDTGVIFGVSDECGNRYEHHPDTMEKIVGFKIPKWDELKELAVEIAMVNEDNHYSSWDFAWTDKAEWVMIEGNASGELLWQTASLCGCRKEIINDYNRIAREYSLV